jgi:hypothetical protein
MEIQKIDKDTNSGQYVYSGTYTTASTALAVAFHDALNIVTVGLSPVSAGTGKVQFTIDPLSAVTADAAEWQDWPAGSISVITTDAIISPVTAVKAVVTSGTMKFRVVG